MADISLNARPRLGAEVRGRSTGERSTIGGPAGPRGIACSVLCPPPPPPPPLGIVSAVVPGGIGFNLDVTFDANYKASRATGLYVLDFGQNFPNDVLLVSETECRLVFGSVVGAGASLIVPEGEQGFENFAGGLLPPGSYPLT